MRLGNSPKTVEIKRHPYFLQKLLYERTQYLFLFGSTIYSFLNIKVNEL
jgi:hypothetical protein